MLMMSSPHNIAGSNPMKRSLFKRPSWSKPQTLSTGADLFHRSNQTYIDVAAAAERHRKRKLARKERELVRRTDSGDKAEETQYASESEDDDDSSVTEEDCDISRDENINLKFTPSKLDESDPALSLPSPNSLSTALRKPDETSTAASKSDSGHTQRARDPHIIDLEDEDEGPEVTRKKRGHRAAFAKSAAKPIEDDGMVSDEEFPELARQARERARRKRLEEDKARAASDNYVDDIPQGHIFQQSVPGYHETPPPPASDPILQILINSKIPNTTPLIVNRKLSQRLKDVKIAWIERQQLTADTAHKVFLTWRGKRLFDVATCKSLGLSVGPNSRMLTTDDSVFDDEGRIHIEAMTAEILEAEKQAKTNEAQTEGDETVGRPRTEDQEKEVQIRIICKAKGFADFKLIVKPVSTSRSNTGV